MMFRIRPDAASIGFGYGQADEVPGFRVKVPGFGVRQRDEVPGFHVGQPDEVPGFRMNPDGTVRRSSPGGSEATYLLDDPHAVRETIPVRCTSDGTTFGCTTPRGKSFSNVPAPANFPARIEPGIPNYHEYGVLSPPGTSSEKLVQGAIDKPTPGPPANPVKSYLWRDKDGKPIIVNVTEPGHGLAPGYVIHYIVETPEGPRIQTEGEGLSPWQAPDRPNGCKSSLARELGGHISKESLTDPSSN